MMPGQVVFMLEEASMKAFLEGLLPRIAPELPCVFVAHEGKQDLEKSLPKKLRAWQVPGARFVVVRDQDSADCVEVKRRLAKIAMDAGKPDAVVRIACRELEAWLLGDVDGLAKALNAPKLTEIACKQKFRDPDHLGSPSRELRQLLGSYSKTAGAREAGGHIGWAHNQSTSFRHFVRAVQRLASE
jgi:hypothetical protein